MDKMIYLIHGTRESTNQKGIVSDYDNVLFLWHGAAGTLIGILAMHINDFIFCENDTFQRNMISELKRKFKFRILENGPFQFLRLGVKQMKDGITIDQNLYASSISTIDIKKGRFLRKKIHKLSQEKKTDLKKKLAGQMIWVATPTQPDVSFDV